MKKIVIGLSIGLFALAGNAQFITAGKLKEINSEGDYGKTLATGYVLGVIDAHDGKAFCIPEGMKAGELKDLIIEAFTAYPTLNKETAADLILGGFSAAYPCQGKKQGQRLL